MDKSAIKTYAVGARRKLIEAVKLKAQQLYIFEDSNEYIKRKITQDNIPALLRSDGIFLSPEQSRAWKRLYSELLYEGSPYKPVIYNRLIENIACTWFNRLIALRIMEVNDWLPSGIRILSSHEQGRTEPDAMREVERLSFVKQSEVVELQANTDIGSAEKLYKYILTSQCNELSTILPGMFQGENDYTELLIPDALLAKGGIVNDLVTLIPENNFNIKEQGQIEIIGWLYQFYISEKKDEVNAQKKNVPINKDTIPAITQLFTPEWIVRYMVENSLGRLWLTHCPPGMACGNAEDALRELWTYYIEEAEQEDDVEKKLKEFSDQFTFTDPTQIKLIDPCMGSGHILVYAFDVLFQIYISQGYSEREIPNLILQNNLYGLDIDDRASQLAYFALMVKARSYNRRFFRQENIPQPMVYAIPETKVNIIGLEKWLGVSMTESDRKASYVDINYIAELFRRGKEYGSLIKIESEVDFKRLRRYVHDFVSKITTENLDFSQQAKHLDRLIDVASVLAQKYDIVVTNPPYMVPAPSQANWIKKNYPNSKSDLCVVFIERNFDLLKLNGYSSMITMHSWMFLSSYEKFREILISTKDIVNMAHLGARAFEEIGGEVVQATMFVMRPLNVADYLATYIRLVDYSSQEAKETAFLDEDNRYITKKKNFTKIPGWIIAYWVSSEMLNVFENGKTLDSVTRTISGSSTGDNARFLRLWFEVLSNKIGFLLTPEYDGIAYKWIPCIKGGGFNRWYGNLEYLINWENNGIELKAFATFKNGGRHWSRFLKSLDCFYRSGVTWSKITTCDFSARLMPEGFILESAANAVLPDSEDLFSMLAFTNSCVAQAMLGIFNPTINVQSGNVASLSLIKITEDKYQVDELTKQCISISKLDWDSFETSWDFCSHPLLIHGLYVDMPNDRLYANLSNKYIEASYTKWAHECENRFQIINFNEEELNRIFINVYGLQNELTPEVKEDKVSISRADKGRDIRSFISYAIGCIFGRYSLDEQGLVFAGGKFDMSRYKVFLPEDDNIVPIGSTDYFNDDIVVRFIDFVRTVYGESTLGENLNFISDALYPNGSGTAQERLRRYFLNDFYKDHVRIYQKRPIYWLLDSGKKDGFKALFYLHRYDKYTIARARTDYLHPLQRKYEAEIKRIEMLSGSTDNAREKAVLRKEIDGLQARIEECRVYDQVVSHIAHQQIELDLDDGVKVNYAKFQGVEVPMDNGKIVTMDLLAKI